MARPPVRKSAPPPERCYRPKVSQPLTEQGRIERHRFYNRVAWAKCRALKLRRDPLCQACRREGKAVEAKHVHHILDLADAPELAYSLDNLESLCHPCHSKITLARLKKSHAIRTQA